MFAAIDGMSKDVSTLTVEIVGTKAISIGSTYRPDKQIPPAVISPMRWHESS
jgi:hypothetical protein